MIEIMQKKLNTNTLLSPYNKMEEIQIIMNKDIIKKDLAKLKEYSDNPKNRYDKANIKGLITYLEKLLKNINEEGVYEMCWGTKNDLPISYPLQLINEKNYNINTSNYIEIGEDEKIIEIDLTELADIIAFEMMARDLGETHESIEELLKDCGLIAIEDSKLLTDMFKANGDKVYQLSKTMKIEDTPYFSSETMKVNDYFSSKQFKANNYREVVEYSCRYANTIIANSILKNSIHNNLNAKIVMINATEITLLANIDNEFNIEKKLLDDISIRTFGRWFSIKPKISVF